MLDVVAGDVPASQRRRQQQAESQQIDGDRDDRVANGGAPPHEHAEGRDHSRQPHQADLVACAIVQSVGARHHQGNAQRTQEEDPQFGRSGRSDGRQPASCHGPLLPAPAHQPHRDAVRHDQNGHQGERSGHSDEREGQIEEQSAHHQYQQNGPQAVEHSFSPGHALPDAGRAEQVGRIDRDQPPAQGRTDEGHPSPAEQQEVGDHHQRTGEKEPRNGRPRSRSHLSL